MFNAYIECDLQRSSHLDEWKAKSAYTLFQLCITILYLFTYMRQKRKIISDIDVEMLMHFTPFNRYKKTADTHTHSITIIYVFVITLIVFIQLLTFSILRWMHTLAQNTIHFCAYFYFLPSRIFISIIYNYWLWH